MYLEKIEIKNYKGIKKIEINFTANKNGIENDIKMHRFREVNNKFIPSVSVLVGCNSIGKTTIINAISFFADTVSGFLKHHIINSLINHEINKNINQKNIVMPLNTNEFVNRNKENDKIVKKIIESINGKKGFLYNKYKSFTVEWFHEFHKKNSFNLSKEIFIKLYFVDDNKKSSYSLAIDEDGKIIINNNGNIDEKEIINFLKFSFLPKRFYQFENISSFLVPNFYQIKASSYLGNRNKNELSFIISRLIHQIGEEKTTKLLQLCDPAIINIKSTRLPNGTIIFKTIILKNGSEIEANDLSGGTIEFIFIFEGIIRAKNTNNKSGGLIIIDEIETKMHRELVQTLIFMLRMIFKNNNFQSIITTHNLAFIEPEISTKQIFSIEKEEYDQEHVVRKVSTLMKPHESISTKYKTGLIAPYPDIHFASETIIDILNE